MSAHPSETRLALLAGGECGRWQGFLLKRHVARCGDCRDTLASFTELRSETLELVRDNADSMPDGLEPPRRRNACQYPAGFGGW